MVLMYRDLSVCESSLLLCGRPSENRN